MLPSILVDKYSQPAEMYVHVTLDNITNHLDLVSYTGGQRNVFLDKLDNCARISITNYCFCINNQEEKIVNQQCQFLKKGTLPTVALMRLLFITPLE
jgi:hypothetical protein